MKLSIAIACTIVMAFVINTAMVDAKPALIRRAGGQINTKLCCPCCPSPASASVACVICPAQNCLAVLCKSLN
ncbi:hypothetical protein BDF19DRAFT_442713 [Syncephalis fuscata]|nr:hypothetical protein BDF19DRAFT_442713 [Syncephalis fuscata]